MIADSVAFAVLARIVIQNPLSAFAETGHSPSAMTLLPTPTADLARPVPDACQNDGTTAVSCGHGMDFPRVGSGALCPGQSSV
jgi:hypothetical protein